jgi:hypothetical protein
MFASNHLISQWEGGTGQKLCMDWKWPLNAYRFQTLGVKLLSTYLLV